MTSLPSSRNWLTTSECAALLNAALDMPGVFRSDFIRGEIDARHLVARVDLSTRGRRFIRIHREDFLSYCQAYHSHAASAVRQRLGLVA